MPRTMLPMMMLRMRRITYSKVGWLSRLGQASQVETPEAPRKNGTCQLWQLESFRNDTEKKKCMSLPNHEIMVRPWLYMVYGCLQNPEVDNRWVQYGTVWFISWSMGFTEVESQVIRLDTITAFTWGLNPGSSSFHANFDGQNHQISKNNAFKQFDHESIILAISQILLLHSQKVCPLNSHLFIRFEGQRQKKSTHQDKVTNSDSMFGKFGEWHVLNNPWFLQASGQKKAF